MTDMSKTPKQAVVEVSSEDGDSYHLVRPADKMTSIYTLYGEMGAQSFILVAATYANLESQGAPLTRQIMYPALRKLITQHWALRQVMVERPSTNKKGQHQFWDAQVHSIDLDRLVEFDDFDDSTGLSEYLERVHNEWLDTYTERSVPFWRLKVVNGRHVVFAFHHGIGDGASGYAFHKGLLKILNEQMDESLGDDMAVFNPPKIDPPKGWMTDFPKAVSIVQLLWDLVFMHFIRYWFKGSVMFDDLPIDGSMPPLSDRAIGHQKRCGTSLRTLRIHAPLQNQLLSACRRHGVTFGTLLHTVSVMTMAADMYPKAKIALTMMPISTRPWAVPPQGPDLIGNSAGAHMRARRLGPYRAAATPPPGQTGLYVDPERTWDVTRSYLQHLRQRFANFSLFNGNLATAMFSNELEVVYDKFFPGLWLYQRFFTSVSNLGAFTPEPGRWTISDVQFSAAALRSNFGFAAPVFNVAAVKGGDCVINCGMEKGLLEPAIIERMLDSMHKRLQMLAEAEQKESESN